MNKLPDGWKIKKLKDISDITSSKRIYEWEYVSSGIPFYRGKEITALKSKHKIENFIYISEARYNELKEKYGVPNKGDILITAVGTIGNAYTIEDDKPFYFKDGNLLWIKNIKEYPKFVEYLFENNKKLFLDNSFGSSQHALTIFKLENLSFYFPPLDEQRRIASGISKIDAYLENTIKLIEEKERFKKGISKKLLTCKEGENVPEMRFKEFNDKWETKTLISVADIKKGEQRNKLDLIPSGKYPVLNGGMNFSGYYNSYNREANTITISEGGNAGYVNFIKEKFWSSGHCYTLHDLKIDKNFLYQCLKNSEKRLMKLGHGTALKNIKISEIIEFTLDMPKSIEEQKIIGEYLSLLDAEIDNLKEQKEEIKKMKSGIIKKLMSGEVRL